MFNRIASRYDVANRVLSFGLDILWRRRMVELVLKDRPERVLDLAGGTGDVTLAFLRRSKLLNITLADFSHGMLEVARKKISGKFPESQISFAQEDAQKMKFDSNSFDALTIAFGIRNIENLEKGLAEMYRVLRNGGGVYVLEFSIPTFFILRKSFVFYLRNIVPMVGNFLTNDHDAYAYLDKSIEAFPYGDEFCNMLRSAGFSQCEVRPLSFGIVTLYKAVK